jgi:hypothetical protein
VDQTASSAAAGQLAQSQTTPKIWHCWSNPVLYIGWTY